MPQPQVDALFLGQFREHAGTSFTCGCSLLEPDRECDIGVALHNLAVRGDWETRKADFLQRGRTGSP